MSNCYVVWSPELSELGFNPVLGVYSSDVSFAELAIKYPRTEGYTISIRPLGDRIEEVYLT